MSPGMYFSKNVEEVVDAYVFALSIMPFWFFTMPRT